MCRVVRWGVRIASGTRTGYGIRTSRAAAVERQVVRVVGVLVRLHQSHQVDEQGRCSICWPVPRTWWRPWPRRSACTVHTALSFYLRQPDRFVLAAITGDVASVRGAS